MNNRSLSSNFSIGQRVRNVRENLGYNREMFAEVLEVSASTLANVELGRIQISKIMLTNLYFIFEISSDDILYGTKKSNTMKDRIIYMIVNLSMNKVRYLYKLIAEYIHYHK